MATSDTYEWRLVGTGLVEGPTDVILPIINSHLYYVINDSGSGELTIPLDSVAAGMVTEGMLAVLRYRGSIRGSFIIENVKTTYISAQEYEGEILSISGLGGMSVLGRAIVWNDGATSSTREFASMTKAGILATLIDEAQARGGLFSLTYDFDAVNDSNSTPWTDSETYNLNVGMTLLEVIHEFAKTGIEFSVAYSGSGFVLSAYKNGIGTDVSNSVFFRVGSNCVEVEVDQRGNDLKNALLVAFQDGSISLADSASITTHGRREKLLDARLAQSASSATTYGAAILESSKDAEVGRVIKAFDGIAPFLFVNYDIGYTITLDNSGVQTADRILGIQCDFNSNGFSNVTLELNSLILEQNLRMRQDVDKLLSNWQTARDANLLEVSYWAAIGDANISITSTADMIKIGSKLYTLSMSAGGWLLSYDTTTGAWSVLVGVGAINTPLVMTSVGTDIYIGGFHAVYKYSTSTGTLTNIGLVVFGDPATEAVWAIGASGTDIYVSGVFDSIDGVAASDLAKYDTLTDTWTAGFGSSVTGVAQVILAVGSDIYMGGSFTAVDGVSVSKVAKWNGATWAALGAGLDFTVYSLVEYGTSILAGGGFTGGISEWNGSTWTVFGGGISSGFVYKIAVYLTDVYIVGTFTDLGNRIARYSGGSWWELGTGLDNTVLDMVLFDNDVYVGGTFTTAGDKPAVGVAAYFNNFEALVDYLENSSSSFNMGAAIHAATASAISDSDEVPFWEDVASALRKITWANIKATLKTYFDTLYVALTGNQTIAGVKTFSSDPIIPDEAYDATAWNGSLEPPTKNALRDKIETMGLPAGSDTQVQVNNSGAFGADDEFNYTLGGQVITFGRKALAEASHIFQWNAPGVDGVSFHNIASWGTGVYSSMRGILARGTKAAPTAAQADDVAMRYRGSAYDGVGLVLSSATGAEIRFVANENQSATNHGMRAEIWTTPNASTIEAVTAIIKSGSLSIVNASDPKLILNEGNTGTSLFEIVDSSSAIGTIKKTAASGVALIDIDPIPADGSSNAGFRFFRSTNTTGQVYLQVYKGDGTATLGGQISGSSANPTFFGTQNNVGIGVASPAGRLHVVGLADDEQFIVDFYSTQSTVTNPIRFRTSAGGDVFTFSALGTFTAILGILSSGATAGIGYTTGAGGTVTQATNKATGVTLNKVTGLITMNNAALAADTTVTFTLTSSAIAATDTIILNHASAGTAGAYTLNAQVAAGSATINVRNITAGSLSEAIVIRFTVIKSISA